MRTKSMIKMIMATLAMMVSLGAGVASAQDFSLCIVYPTLCNPPAGPMPVGPLGLPGYAGNSPIYPPNVLVPNIGFVVQDTLNALPPGVRQGLFPPQVAGAVNSGAVDFAIGNALGNGVLPNLGVINGFGPGGSGYTNQAAIDLLNGTSQLWQLGFSLSPIARQLSGF